jgi:SpoVK/Ycf46/Vps4 family AAA+-type ATPase
MTPRKTTRADAARSIKLSPEQALAGRYLQNLASRLRASFTIVGQHDAHEDDDDDLVEAVPSGETDAQGQGWRRRISVDTGLVATRLARAVAGVPDLAEALEAAKPMVVIIHAADAESCEGVKRALRQCVLPTNTEFTAQHASTATYPAAHLHVDDGSETSRHWRKTSAQDIRQAIRRGQCVICITTNPRSLPDLARTHAVATLRLPPPDAWSLKILAQFRFGMRATVTLDETVARGVDPIGLLIAWRDVQTADEALQALIDAARTRTRPAAKGPKLSDLEGYGAVKVWGMELAADLQAMAAGKLAWADIDHKGLLLSGPPGTGKTTFAQALANEAGVPLIATSVADWTRADHLGITQQKMQQSFTDAMAQAPSILFIDELDGIADRGTLRGHNAEYWTHVINALLELLAGVEGRDGVVVIGASNFPDKIDAAVRRSGRLDRHIRIPRPDLPALVQILRYHLRGDLPGVDLKGIAASLLGQTGADVEALVRRARGQARRRGRPLALEDLSGIIAQDGEMTSTRRMRVALHEAGHALVARLKGRQIEQAVLTPLGGCVTTIDPEVGYDAIYLDDSIVIGLAGRAAEDVVFGPRSILSGGEQDLEKTTEIALAIETRLGFGESGLLHHGSLSREHLLMIPHIREAVLNRLHRCHHEAYDLIEADGGALMAIAVDLTERSYLSPEDIDAAIARGRTEQKKAARSKARSTAKPAAKSAANGARKPGPKGGAHVA